LTPLLVLAISGCEGSQKDVAGANARQQPAVTAQAPAKKLGTDLSSQQVPINRQFRSLDEYLAHLELTEGPVDRPWYKQVRPGIYELQTGNLRVLGDVGEEAQIKHTFTREELERKFGFAK
jgi:hypothetical protein